MRDIPEYKYNKYRKGHVHNWVNRGEYWQCMGCPAKKFPPKKVVRTFP